MIKNETRKMNDFPCYRVLRKVTADGMLSNFSEEKPEMILSKLRDKSIVDFIYVCWKHINTLTCVELMIMNHVHELVNEVARSDDDHMIVIHRLRAIKALMDRRIFDNKMK